jgi:hypothetical protein
MASCGQHDCHRETVDAGSALSVGDRSNNACKRARWEKIATFDDQRVSMWGIAAGIDYIASPHASSNSTIYARLRIRVEDSNP